ncbi:ParB N-terminal domain-containing protein [Paenibacillus massiliensis]|uniref:ParB N-terminal domain-containing protein n=1 Tax=Paenibacillus massiliensis TaxID=225917 RepID=UPI00046F4E56|nr:ParB N-terminal domain-containing protein [Paenibacillus massiliensis]
MIEYEDKNEFDLYYNALISSIEDDTYISFMRNNKYPLIYIKERQSISNSPEYYTTHYVELPIEKITGCNVSSARKEIIDPNNWERVIGSIKYILNNECEPIHVIKHGKGKFYIENGKHRYYAHLLLRKDTIPVSLKIISETAINESGKSIIVSDGLDSSYRNPANAIALFEQYKESFGEVTEVIMKGNQELLEFTLKLKNSQRQAMVFHNILTSGNKWMSSGITCDILQRSGFNVDMKYISENTCFHLIDKRDAHHISFNNTSIEFNAFLDLFMNEVSRVESYDGQNHELYKLHDYICREPNNKTCGTHFSGYSSFICHGNENTYFIVGTETIGTNQDTIYIFKDVSYPFNNLTVEFITKLPKEDAEYNTFLEVLRRK